MKRDVSRNDSKARTAPAAMSGLGLFAPHRAVGLVCSDTPPFLNTLGTENFLVVAIDKSFQVLDASNLSTRAVSPPLRKRIRYAFMATPYAARIRIHSYLCFIPGRSFA